MTDFLQSSPKTSSQPFAVKLPHIASQVVASIAEDVMYNDARLPFGFDEAYQVLLNKTTSPVVEPSQTRPLVLQNALAKLLPAVVNVALAKHAPQFLHGAQYGFLTGRSIPAAALHLEELALRVSKTSKFATLLFTDLHQAFPSLRRN
eukprot:5376565-Amphidinium_carterae.1